MIARFAFWSVILGLATPVAAADDLRITVVAILASDRHSNIDPKLQNLAADIRQKDASLTGFRIERVTLQKAADIGVKGIYPLIGNLNAEVTLVARDDIQKRARLTVKVPTAGEITYSTTYGKFFPIVTRHQTDSDKERLIVAIMIKRMEEAK